MRDAYQCYIANIELVLNRKLYQFKQNKELYTYNKNQINLWKEQQFIEAKKHFYFELEKYFPLSA